MKINSITHKTKEVIMSTRALSRRTETLPGLMDDFLRPWNEWFDGGFVGKTMNIPAVNIEETKDGYEVSLAAPGMKKEDFYVNVDGNLITISSEKEETTEEKEKQFTRKEFNYSSFSRTFTIPEEVEKEKIDAFYTDGVLKLSLPKKEEAKKASITKNITVR